MSNESRRIGEVDPTHVGPPGLILQEIVAPDEVPEDIRKRFETDDNRPVSLIPIADGGVSVDAPPGAGQRARWADVTFAGLALAVAERTDQPDYDDYHDPLVWVFAVSAESPVLGETIVSTGGFASSSGEIRYSNSEPTRRGKRVSFFSAIRTERRNT